MNHHAPRSTRRHGRLLMIAGALLSGLAFAGNLTGASAATATGVNAKEECKGHEAFESWSLMVDGKLIPSGNGTAFRSALKQGSNVKVDFKVKPECSGVYVEMSTWTLPSAPPIKTAEFRQQKLVERKGSTFASGAAHSISAVMPNCWFQVDIVNQVQYDFPGGATDSTNRTLHAHAAGTDSCANIPAATTTTSTAAPTTTSTTEAPTTTTSSTVAPQEVKPSATVAAVCSPQTGVLIKMRNDGNTTTPITVTADGHSVEGSPFSVGPQGTKQILIPTGSKKSVAVRVQGSINYKDSNGQSVVGPLLVEKVVDMNCTVAATTTSTVVTEVRGATVLPAAALAETGLETSPLAGFGFLLMGIGGLLMLFGRKSAALVS